MAAIEWSKEEDSQLVKAWEDTHRDADTMTCVRAIATRAVELVAARGGTMTAEEVSSLTSGAGPNGSRRLRAHIIALGARIAALEGELAATERANMALLADVGKVLDQRDGEATLDACERVMRTLDEALADNVALVDHARTERQMLALLYHRIKALGVHTDAMADAVTTVERWMDAVPDTYESPHPGAALLEQHCKEVAALKADLAKLEELAAGTCSPEEWTTQEARKVAEVLTESASALARERVERYAEACELKQRIAKARAEGRSEGLTVASAAVQDTLTSGLLTSGQVQRALATLDKLRDAMKGFEE